MTNKFCEHMPFYRQETEIIYMAWNWKTKE